jgi:hypothetical protein
MPNDTAYDVCLVRNDFHGAVLAYFKVLAHFTPAFLQRQNLNRNQYREVRTLPNWSSTATVIRQCTVWSDDRWLIAWDMNITIHARNNDVTALKLKGTVLRLSNRTAVILDKHMDYISYNSKHNNNNNNNNNNIFNCKWAVARWQWLYGCAGKSLARPTSRCILFDGWNISFDASLVICINSTNIPGDAHLLLETCRVVK